MSEGIISDAVLVMVKGSSMALRPRTNGLAGGAEMLLGLTELRGDTILSVDFRRR